MQDQREQQQMHRLLGDRVYPADDHHPRLLHHDWLLLHHYRLAWLHRLSHDHALHGDDLRLHDNPALHAAASECADLVIVSLLVVLHQLEVRRPRCDETVAAFFESS